MKFNFNTIKKKNQPYIIAEVGVNHECSLALAKKLILQAKYNGAQAVKFQTYLIDDYIHNKKTERYNRLNKFQLTFSEFLYLKKLSHKLNLKFISTPLDKKSAKFICCMGSLVRMRWPAYTKIQK